MSNIVLVRVVLFSIMLLLLVSSIMCLRSARKKRRRYSEALEVAGKEIEGKFAEQLLGIYPDVYRRGMGIQLHTEVESVKPLKWYKPFYKERKRILLIIRLGQDSDLQVVETMARQFLSEYLSQPGMRNCAVRVFFQPAPSNEEKG